jgi:hypothetical protein
MNKTLKALALSAATAFPASAALSEEASTVESISQEQRVATAEAMGECVGNRVYGAIQATALHYVHRTQEQVDKIREIEVLISFNSMVECFAEVTGYNRMPLADQAPDWPEIITDLPDDIYTNLQAQEDIEVRAIGDWASLMEAQMDMDTYQNTYQSITGAIPLLR